MQQRCDTRDCEQCLSGKVIDDVRFHIALNQQDPFPDRADQMTPVLTLGAIQFIRAGEGEELSAFFHLLVQPDLEALDFAKVPPGYHDPPAPKRSSPPAVLVTVEAGHTEQGMPLVQQGLRQCMETHDRRGLISQPRYGLVRQTARKQIFPVIRCQSELTQ